MPDRLHVAVVEGDVATALTLLNGAVGIEDRNANGWTALMEAAAHGQADMVRMLLAMGADIDARTRGGSTALMLAVAVGDGEMVSLLLEAGSDVRALGLQGTALTWAVRMGHFEIARTLLDAGAVIDEADLFLAICGGRSSTALVQLLLERGADVDMPDARGRTALD